MKHASLGIVVLLAPLVGTLIGCAAPALTADPSLLEAWTPEAQGRMPEPPYVARYERDGKALSFLAARHEHVLGSATFLLVEEEIESFRPEVVLIEGLETRHGFSPKFYVDEARVPRSDDRYPMGEPGFAASLAAARDIPFLGGEPSDEEVHEAIVGDEFELIDIVYFYVVRQIPQWKRNGEDEERDFEELSTRRIATEEKRLRIPVGTFARRESFEAWYARRNGRPFDYDEINTQPTAPLDHEGALFTNLLSCRVGEVRDTHIVRQIAALLAHHDRVLVIYGAGHHVQQKRVLEAMLGTPRPLAED